MNLIYDETMAKVNAAVANIFTYRAVLMTNAVDSIVRRGMEVVDTAGMRAAWHAVTCREVRQDRTFRIILTEMGRDATDAPISGTHIKVSKYEEVHAHDLGPVFVNIRKDALKLKERSMSFHVDLDDFAFERYTALDATLGLAFRLDYSFNNSSQKFIEALLAMYRQRPRETRAA